MGGEKVSLQIHCGHETASDFLKRSHAEEFSCFMPFQTVLNIDVV